MVETRLGYSGAKLYDDDAAVDVKGRYRELVADGVEGPAATDLLVQEWGAALEDADEACAFWLALADTQWRIGRLEDRVKNRATSIIDGGQDLRRFGHDPKLRDTRARVLLDLSDRLRRPQPALRRIRRPFRAVSPVNPGDVFAYEIAEDKWAYFRCVAVTGDERDSQPTVEVLDWNGAKDPPDPAMLVARRPKGRRPDRPDLFWMMRYPSDPDPASRIRMLATQTPINRRRMLPAQMVPWTDLETALDKTFDG